MQNRAKKAQSTRLRELASPLVCDPQPFIWRKHMAAGVKAPASSHLRPRRADRRTGVHALVRQVAGDLLATGTDHGGLHPLQDGDVIEMECHGLGRLRIRVRDDLKRTWARESRIDRYMKGLTGTTPQVTGRYARRS